MVKYICFEGTEGRGKTVQTQLLVDYLRNKGFKVLQTKEPGTPHLPLTMKLRDIMLNYEYNDEMTANARELISQAIRSIHLEKLVYTHLDYIPSYTFTPYISKDCDYDYIIQDRGILSGIAYGRASGHSETWLNTLFDKVTHGDINIYDNIIFLDGDIELGLERANICKKEFAKGDVIERKGLSFMKEVHKYFLLYLEKFRYVKIHTDNKSIGEIHNEIIQIL